MNSIENHFGLGGIWIVGIAIGAGLQLLFQVAEQLVINLL